MLLAKVKVHLFHLPSLRRGAAAAALSVVANLFQGLLVVGFLFFAFFMRAFLFRFFLRCWSLGLCWFPAGAHPWQTCCTMISLCIVGCYLSCHCAEFKTLVRFFCCVIALGND